MEFTRHLIKQDYVRLAKAGNIYHPIIGVLEDYEPRIRTLCAQQENGYGHGLFAAGNQDLGFLADAFEGIERDFTFSSLELIAIWTEMQKIFGDNFRNDRAAITTAAYVTSGIASRAWEGFPRYWLWKRSFKPEMCDDANGCSYLIKRLGNANAALDELKEYTYGPGGIQRLWELEKEAQEGDDGAKSELGSTWLYISEHEDPLIEDIVSRFDHSISILHNHIFSL